MVYTNQPIDLDRLATLFAIELHIDSALLGTVVRQVVHDAYGRSMNAQDFLGRLADEIEDNLGYLGDDLGKHLNDAARLSWRRDCSQAFEKALQRCAN